MGLTSATGSLSRESAILLITSSLGGVVLAVFVVYVIIRLRQGFELVDVLKLRRTARTYVVDEEDHPIRWEQRYSVRSSHYRRPSNLPSVTIAARRQKDVPTLPLPVAQKFKSKNAYYRWYWREKAQPSTPVHDISSYFMNAPGRSPSTLAPEMDYTNKGRHSTIRHSTATSKSYKSYKSYKSAKSNRPSKTPTVSVHDLPELPSPKSMSSRRYTQWSWTNSEAPATPKVQLDIEKSSARSAKRSEPRRLSAGSANYVDPRRLSTGSSTKYRQIGAWAQHQMESIEENGLGTSTASIDTHPTETSETSRGLRTFFRFDAT